MSQVQSGILPEHCRAAIWIEANVKGDVDTLRAASKVFVDKLATFQAKFPDAHLGAVVAFGNNVWRQLSGGEGAEELKDFIPYGKGLAPATQFDVLIHILSLRHDVNFSVAQAAMQAFGDSIEVQEEVHGFRWVEERDLSGFVDGTENPAGEEIRRDVAVIKDGIDAGGSYVFVQRWEHNLGFTAKANNGLVTFWILLWSIGQITQFLRQTIAEAEQLFHQRRTGFARFREGIRRQEDTGRAIAKHKVSVRFLARQFWQRNRIFFRRCNFAVTQNLTAALRSSPAG
jgi:hypothetical protein